MAGSPGYTEIRLPYNKYREACDRRARLKRRWLTGRSVRPVSTSSNAKVARCGRPLPIIGIVRFWDATRSFSLFFFIGACLRERKEKRVCGVSVMASPETNVTSSCCSPVWICVRVHARVCVCVVGSRFFSLSLSLCHFSVDHEMSTSSGLSASNARRYRFMGEERERERERERRRTLDCILRIESLILKRFTLQFMAPSSDTSRISSREKFINGQFPNEYTRMRN